MDKEVIVGFVDVAENETMCVVQTGILLGSLIITPSNFLCNGSKFPPIYILCKREDKITCHQPSTIIKLTISSLRNVCYDFFNHSDNCSPFLIDSSRSVSDLSVFLALTMNVESVLLTGDKVLPSSLSESFMPFQNGEEIMVSYAPGGDRRLFGTVSGGVISNTYGVNKDVILLDARLSIGCEGAPIYRLVIISNFTPEYCVFYCYI